ncbi:hypothetical protein IK112_02400 [Candidatus Saccharibacteria bacterium]|nr:hypothetical protein [Candidatus Saccharibacteria bacterium]
MYIFSIILTTIVSAISAGITIIASCGGFVYSYANPTAGIIPRTVTPLLCSLILPLTFLFFILSFTTKTEKKSSKAPSLLKIAFLLTFLQALASVIIYQINYEGFTSTDFSLNIVPVIIEGIIILATFIGAILLSIKATKEDQISFSHAPRLFTFITLSLGLLMFVLDLVSIIIFRASGNNSAIQPLFKLADYLRMLLPAIFALAALNSLRKPDKYFVLSWLGVFLGFSAHILLYTVAYI